jgi:serine/threonine protein kinase/tetratricopeptide (TPR) repeat protein
VAAIMTLRPSQLVGRYRVVAALGRGGMGEVYRATDTDLNRDIALKVLSPDFREDADRLRRFRQEAQAAAALNHPNILAVFDVGSADGIPFLICELLDGETLRERLRGGPLAASEVREYGAQLARGLAAAHDAGIIHRDLKPENLFITVDGHVKILDFGLAKQSVDARTEPDVLTVADTTPGIIVGTVPYLSPEQVRAEPASAQSDIFALGAVLFEMLCARPAFAAPSAAETISAILTHDPLSAVPRDFAPAALVAIVRHCLEKQPRQRFRSAHDVAFALTQSDNPARAGEQPQSPRTRARRGALLAMATMLMAIVTGALWMRPSPGPPAAPPASSEAKSIAALPFRSVGADASDDYFTDGMTDSLITDLSKISGLIVLARSAVFRYKTSIVDARQVGRELGARYVLQGSVQRAGGRVRVNAQLVEASSGMTVWADRFDEDAKDLFALQDRISTALVSAMQVRLAPAPGAPASARRTSNPRAYDAYLQGLYYRHQPVEVHSERPIAFFQQAIAEDPDFALAHAALGSAYTQRFFYVDANPQLERNAFAAIGKALELDSDLAEAYLARGQLAWSLPNGFPHESAVRDLKRAVALNPGLAEAHRELGKIYLHVGLLDKAVEANTVALRLDPADSSAMRRRSAAYVYRRECTKALELAPDEHRIHVEALMCLGRDQEALALTTESAEANDKSMRAVLLARMGKEEGARRAIADIKLEAANVAGLSDLHHAQYNIGITHALLGDAKTAMVWLKKAAREGLPCYPLYEQDPGLASLRSHPEFVAFMQQLREQWERFSRTL